MLNVLVFIGKGWLLVFVMMWMRWSLPRLRIDQVMMTCLKYFLPISCVLLLGVCVWELYVPNGGRDGVAVRERVRLPGVRPRAGVPPADGPAVDAAGRAARRLGRAWRRR